MKGTRLKISLTSLFVFIALGFSLAQQPTSIPHSDTQIPLEQFVGYYHVGVKPNKPFFMSRWYLKDGKLFTIYDSDRDRELIPYINGKLNPTIFLSEEDVEITEKDSTYYLVLNFEDDRLKSFKVIRPRSEWPTDLYGYRIDQYDKLAIDTESSLTYRYETEHFRFASSPMDTAQIPELGAYLEREYERLLQEFRIESLPITNIRIYPDYTTYHNAVLTPNAPKWQRGRVWDVDEIRMLSPITAEKVTGEQVEINGVVLHEFIHCLHLNLIKNGTRVPGWLWEGIAMYKGCCNWVGNPNELTYIQQGKRPSLKQIERDRAHEIKYDLGYFMIEYLDKTYGWEKILQLIDNNGDIEDALNISRKEFQAEFYDFIEDNY